MRLYLPALALIFCACGSLSTTDKEAAELHLKIGTGELRNGAYPQALATLLKAEGLDPENANIQNNLGLAYLVREKYAEAEKHIRKAILLQPDYSDARNNLGHVLLEEGRYPEAIAELEVAENDLTYLNPEKPLINLGMVYFKMQDYKNANLHFLKALNIQRDSCTAHSFLGRSYFEQKEFNKSSAELDRAVAYCQKDLYDEPHYYSALSYYQLGQSLKAQARLEELIKLFPNGKYYDKAKSMLELMKR